MTSAPSSSNSSSSKEGLAAAADGFETFVVATNTKKSPNVQRQLARGVAYDNVKMDQKKKREKQQTQTQQRQQQQPQSRYHNNTRVAARRNNNSYHHRPTGKSCNNNNNKSLSLFGRSKWTKPSMEVVDKEVDSSKSKNNDKDARTPSASFCSSSLVENVGERIIVPSSPSQMMETNVGVGVEESGGGVLQVVVGREEDGGDALSNKMAFDLFPTRATTQPLLSSLLAEYGEQDLDWKKNNIIPMQDDVKMGQQEVVVESEESLYRHQTSSVGKTAANDDHNNNKSNNKAAFESRLGPHGKAPIHVEFVSFGYQRGGSPPTVNLFSNQNGWGRHALAQPLLSTPTIDTRILLPSTCTVPPYLAWQDGLSGAVKRALLYAGDGGDTGGGGSSSSSSSRPVRTLAQDVSDQVGNALVEAMDEGGHGYVSPLHCKIFIGSELGRHRSVVVAEMAATALRKLLRSNAGNRFACPCSVGTRHWEIERKRQAPRGNSKSTAKPKQKELEDDW